MLQAPIILLVLYWALSLVSPLPSRAAESMKLLNYLKLFERQLHQITISRWTADHTAPNVACYVVCGVCHESASLAHSLASSVTPRPFSARLFPAYADAWCYSSPGAELCTPLPALHEVSVGPILKFLWIITLLFSMLSIPPTQHHLQIC